MSETYKLVLILRGSVNLDEKLPSKNVAIAFSFCVGYWSLAMAVKEGLLLTTLLPNSVTSM